MADPFATNPALDDLRAQSPEVVTMALRTDGPAPTLFPTGDLPAATASGNPPAMLTRLPWRLRHAAAKADASEWARLLNEYSRGIPDADLLAEFDGAAQDPANDDYIARVTAWASGLAS